MRRIRETERREDGAEFAGRRYFRNMSGHSSRERRVRDTPQESAVAAGTAGQGHERQESKGTRREVERDSKGTKPGQRPTKRGTGTLSDARRKARRPRDLRLGRGPGRQADDKQ